VDDDCDGTVDEGCDSCFHWSGTPSLGQALSDHDCVEIQSGTFDLDSTVYVPANRELRGLGHDQSILVPSASFGDTALVVVNQSHVDLKRFRVRGDSGAGAVLNIVVLGASTTNVVLDELLIDGAKCDGLSMGGEGTTIQNSVLRNNGYDCPPINTGSAIYAEGNVTIPGSQHAHALQIVNNLIEENPYGSGIDLAEVADGYIAQNTIRNNGANGGISLYHCHDFVVEHNDISNSGGWVNYGHPSCEGIQSPATIGIKLCRDADIFGGTDHNIIRYNTSVGYYGILLAGDDETTAYLVPRFNEIHDNDVMGSTVGCLDDFQPGQWTDGDNLWTGNNCGGTPNSPPDYF
jgi:parallel beta-helix repeat protein